MSNAFWNGFGSGFSAVDAARENHGKAKYARTGELNALMAVNPEAAQRIAANQQVYDQTQTAWDQQQQSRQAQKDAGTRAAGGDYRGARDYALENGLAGDAAQYDHLFRGAQAEDIAAAERQAQIIGQFSLGASQLPQGEGRNQWILQNAAQFGMDPNEALKHADDASLQQHVIQAIGVTEASRRAMAAQAQDQQLAEQRRYHDAIIAERRTRYRRGGRH